MRHRCHGKKFSRTKDHRKALFSNMLKAFFLNESITTTLPKAREIARQAEKIITTAKSGTLAARREVAKVIKDKTLVKKIFEDVAPRFKERPGGYTRVYKLDFRHGDNAPLALLEMVVKAEKEKKKIKKEKKAEKKPVEKRPAEKQEEKKIPEKDAKETIDKKDNAERTKRGRFPGFNKFFRRKSFGKGSGK